MLCDRTEMRQETSIWARLVRELRRGPVAEARGDSAKRRQILDGARRMFLAQGFDAASMGEIAREAGVSKGTLYVYFKSKEELFEAIVEAQVPGSRASRSSPSTVQADIEARAASGSVGSSRASCCRPGGVSALAHRDGHCRSHARARRQVLPRRVRRTRHRQPEGAIWRSKVAAGVLEPHDCEVAAAQFIDACLSTTFKPMLFNHAGPPSEERIGHVVDMAVGAFLAAYRKG